MTTVDIGSRLIVRARRPFKELKYSVWEVMQVDRERNEVLLEACIENKKRRLKTALWVSADDPRFIFEREI